MLAYPDKKQRVKIGPNKAQEFCLHRTCTCTNQSCEYCFAEPKVVARQDSSFVCKCGQRRCHSETKPKCKNYVEQHATYLVPKPSLVDALIELSGAFLGVSPMMLRPVHCNPLSSLA